MRITKNSIVSFVTSNLEENTPVWVMENFYDYTNEVLYEDYIYKYTGENNTNTEINPTLSDKWTRIRPSNKIALLDNKPSTKSIRMNKIEVSFISKGYDKLAFLNVIAKNIIVEIIPFGYTKAQKTIPVRLLNTKLITTLREFATEELQWSKTAYVNLPIVYNATIKVTIENEGNIAQCGHLISGNSFYVGSTNFDINLGLSSFKNKKLDDFGEYSYINRGIADVDDFKITFDTSKVGIIKQKIKEMDGLLLLFTIIENKISTQNIVNFGYWEDFYILISGPVKSEANLKIQGVL